MILQLNSGGIGIKLRVSRYFGADCGILWSRIGYLFYAGDYLYYLKENDAVMENIEIDELIVCLEELLAGELTKTKVISFVEPDFKFVLYPKETVDLKNSSNVLYSKENCVTREMAVDWILMFWSDEGAETANHLSVRLYAQEIKYLLYYLKLITGSIDVNDPLIIKMMDQKVIIEAEESIKNLQ